MIWLLFLLISPSIAAQAQNSTKDVHEGGLTPVSSTVIPVTDLFPKGVFPRPPAAVAPAPPIPNPRRFGGLFEQSSKPETRVRLITSKRKLRGTQT